MKTPVRASNVLRGIALCSRTTTVYYPSYSTRSYVKRKPCSWITWRAVSK